jgi:hypothetical protein
LNIKIQTNYPELYVFEEEVNAQYDGDFKYHLSKTDLGHKPGFLLLRIKNN